MSRWLKLFCKHDEQYVHVVPRRYTRYSAFFYLELHISVSFFYKTLASNRFEYWVSQNTTRIALRDKERILYFILIYLKQETAESEFRNVFPPVPHHKVAPWLCSSFISQFEIIPVLLLHFHSLYILHSNWMSCSWHACVHRVTHVILYLSSQWQIILTLNSNACWQHEKIGRRFAWWMTVAEVQMRANMYACVMRDGGNRQGVHTNTDKERIDASAKRLVAWEISNNIREWEWARTQ